MRQIGAKQPDPLNGGDTHVKMAFGQFDIFVFPKNTRPFFACLVKKGVDSIVGNLRIRCLAELDHLVPTVFHGLLFIPYLGKDQFENLVELIFSAVCQNQLFQILNDLLEIEISFELENRPFLAENIFGRFTTLGQVGQSIVKFLRVRSVKDDACYHCH